MTEITFITIEGYHKSAMLKLLERWLVFMGYKVKIVECPEHILEVYRNDD